MINIYSKKNHALCEIEHFSPDCWANLIEPTEEEVQKTIDYFQVERSFITAALDEEESAQFQVEDDASLVIVDIPAIQAEGKESFLYTTIPLAIILCPKGFITVCTRETTVLEDFIEGRVRLFSVKKRTRFLLQILYRIASKFLQYLKQIDKASTILELELQKSMKNRELIKIMRLEKSLVYFSTSLKGNEAILEKLLKSKAITYYADDEDLLQDVIVENKQAIEMCSIYRDILNGTMDAFASIISNNLNIVMKRLTTLTIVMTIPQLVFGLFGINTGIPWEGNQYGFIYVTIISVALSVIAAIILWRKKMF